MTCTHPLRIRLEPVSTARVLAGLILLLPVSFAALEWMGIVNMGKLAVDAAWIGLGLIPVLKGRAYLRRDLLPLVIPVLTLLLGSLVVYLFRYQSGFYFLWGARNYLRFYVLFFGVACCFRVSDGIRCLNILDRLFWPNFLLCLGQFFRGYRQDYLGGLFGVSRGCNGFLIIYFTLVITRSLLNCMQGKESLPLCLAKSGAALAIAALSELKFFFFLYLFLLAMATLLTPLSVRKLLMLSIGGILVFAAAWYLGRLYQGFRGFLSPDALREMLSATGYATADDLGRFSALTRISELFLKDPISRLFGLGLGNCDYSSLALFRTPFYETYRELHYTYFSHAFLFLETGYAGLTLYASFFILCFGKALGKLRSGLGNPELCRMAVILAPVCLLLTVYNASLRTEAGYLLYFVLALPFATEEVDSSV